MRKLDYKKTLEYLRYNLKVYIKENNLKSLILGVSGGIDSALVAAISKPICDEIKIPLIGISIPSKNNKSDESIRAVDVMSYFCTEFYTCFLDPHMASFKDISEWETCIAKTKEDKFGVKIRNGNIQARIRMILLYDKAWQNKGCVLSTDNLTEHYLGFWTLHGDVGDIGIIQNLWKTEVYELAEYIINNDRLTVEQEFALYTCINAIPTDGLGITDSDFDQLGVNSYQEIDKIFDEYFSTKEIPKGEDLIIQRYIKTMYKRNIPINFKIEECCYEKNNS